MEHAMELAHYSRPLAEGYERIGMARHPANREPGMLLRHIRTGRYVLDVLGVHRSVPQAWARGQAVPAATEEG